jgi:hypothetical protein
MMTCYNVHLMLQSLWHTQMRYLADSYSASIYVLVLV